MTAMSHDQKPQRIRPVANPLAVGAPAAAALSGGAHAAKPDDISATASQAASPAISLLAILLFLIACGAGGVLAAMLPRWIS